MGKKNVKQNGKSGLRLTDGDLKVLIATLATKSDDFHRMGRESYDVGHMASAKQQKAMGVALTLIKVKVSRKLAKRGMKAAGGA